jgi:hypothetical protein
MVADVLVFVALVFFASGFFLAGYLTGREVAARREWKIERAILKEVQTMPEARITNITAARGFPRSRKPHK